MVVVNAALQVLDVVPGMQANVEQASFCLGELLAKNGVRIRALVPWTLELIHVVVTLSGAQGDMCCLQHSEPVPLLVDRSLFSRNHPL